MRNLTGQRFGDLVVLSRDGSRCGHAAWLCRCDCGKRTTSIANNLVRGLSTTCGCRGARMIERTCKQCGLLFERISGYLSESDAYGQFCSVTCRVESRRGIKPPNYAGGRHIFRGHVRVLAHGHPRENRHGYVYEHILVAEKALGRHLPIANPVHHHDRDRANNANRNLVICENAGYHNLLHARMRIVDAGGDPDSQQFCSNCKTLKSHLEFWMARSRWNGRNSECKDCCRSRRKDQRTPYASEVSG